MNSLRMYGSVHHRPANVCFDPVLHVCLKCMRAGHGIYHLDMWVSPLLQVNNSIIIVSIYK